MSHRRPHDIPSPCRRRPADAFTLIELLVVVFIIIILVSTAVPAVKALSKNNGQKQTVNMLTSMVSQARSQAIQSHAMAGVYIYEDAKVPTGISAALTATNATNQTYAQLVFSFSEL